MSAVRQPSPAVLVDTPPDQAGIAVVPPPVVLQRFVPVVDEGPGTWVDYSTHPAYRALVQPSSLKVRLSALLGFVRAFALILCKRLISYELIPGHLRRPASTAGLWRLAAKGGSNMLRSLAPDTQRSAATDAGRRVQEALARDGICVAQLEPLQFAAIASAVKPLFDNLRRVRGERSGGGREFDESRSYAVRTAHSELFAAVESIFGSSGLLDGVSAYLGRPAALVDVNPQINDITDDFWRRIFPDMNRQDRAVAYLHRDASGGDVKAIFYMSDVGPASGPFSYVIGSHRQDSGTLGNWIEESNDQSGYSGTGPLNRARFAALPSMLRRKCAFGNDVLAGTAIERRLLDAEWTVTASRGNVVLFDTKGFHRGGMVTSGERLALTCVIG